MNALKLDITREPLERRLRQARITRSGVRTAPISMIIALGLLPTLSAYADSYPASYWTTKSMSVPVDSCVHAAGKAVQGAGLSDITKSDMATGGHTPTTRGYIVCVRLPKAGACQGDGATAVIVTAGAGAKSLLEKITTHLKVPVMVDCWSGNPVNE